jgi:hypothetical protein
MRAPQQIRRKGQIIEKVATNMGDVTDCYIAVAQSLGL